MAAKPVLAIPHSVDAETAVLGAVLLDPTTLDRILPIVGEADFYVGKHRIIFAAMVAEWNRNRPIDLVTLVETLTARGELVDVGGAASLSSLLDAAITAANAEHYARVVREKALLRSLGAVTTEIARRSYEPQEEVEEFIDEAERTVLAVAERRPRQHFVRAETLIGPAMQRIERLYEVQDAITGVPTGFTAVDRMTAGLQPANLVIVAGRPSVGKTSFCLNVMTHAAIRRGIGAAILSLEMSKEELVIRILCSEAEIDLRDLRTGRLRQRDFPPLSMAIGRIAAAPIYIDDSPALTAADLRARARRLARQSDARLGLLIVDYLQLMRGAPGAKSREQEIAEISRSLKALAKELDVPVVALSQLNREVEKRPSPEPRMADLRESGSLEQDADVIAFLYRERIDVPDDAETLDVILAIEKQRNGPTGKVPLVFRRRLARFEDPEAMEPLPPDD
ncbi:MAG: replicative helicase [Candidatus Binatota bacterium]|jgi:replicative DNA helicase|nr:replicative helicase [Candidatus Binatota bacterium]